MMDRFDKLLGRKSGRPASDEPSAQAQKPVQGQPPEQIVGGSTASEQAFGLKFVFDTGDSRMYTSLPVTIGRASENDLVIPDDSVSAHHAVVLYDEQVKEICIVDLDSLNGVVISDHPTLKNVLTDGTRIGLGKVHMVFRDTGYIHPA